MTADHERHRAARRLHSLRRHVPRLLGLRPQCRAPGGADASARILVYTHDSIGLGEDGPTHQPIEHLASLRAMPEHARCGGRAMRSKPPSPGSRRSSAATAPLRSCSRARPCRSSRAPSSRSPPSVAAATCSSSANGAPECIVIATGSEVGIAADAVQALKATGRRVRLVSMPSADVFDAQDEAYREQRAARERSTRRVAVEAAATGRGGATSAARGACSASTASARPARPRICSRTSASRRRVIETVEADIGA